LPTATAAAPKAKVSEKIIRTETRDAVEVPVVLPSAVPEPTENFWEFIERLTDDDWKNRGYKVQLYRYPLGQVKPQKLGRYCKCYKGDTPLRSAEQIFEEFGGSQYDAMLTGPKEGSVRGIAMLARHSWEMDGPAKNPWAIAAAPTAAPSELAATLQVVLQNLQNAQKSPNPAADPALTSSIALIKQLTDAVKPQGVGELVGALADLQKLTGEPSGGSGSLRETLTLLKELGIVGESRERRSLATELKEIMEIAGMVGGGASSGGRTDWPTALVQNLPGILEKVTPIADKFADAARSNARVAELRAGGRPPLPATAPAAPVVRPAPAAESPAARTVATPDTEPAATAVPERFRAPNLEWVKGKAVQMFQQGKAGDAIAEFLDNLDTRLGDFFGSMDEAKFRAFVEGDAILSQIASAPRYTAFVHDFVDYFSTEPEPGASTGTAAEENS